MEQKTINQNKLQSLLCIIALTLGVLVSAVLFSMLPVHAAGNLTSEYYVYNYYDIPSGRHSETKFTFSTSATNIVGISSLISDNYFTFSIRFYDSVDRKFYSLPSNLCTWHTEGTYYKNPELNYSDDNISNHFLTTAYYGTYNSDNGLMSVTYECNFPVFDTYDHALAYVQNGNEDGMLNKPELPNNNDETYCFTGFTMNGKTARWNGTTERSYAKEVDVEEYVKVSYAWATTTEPDNLGELQPYDGEFSTSDKRLTLPWSEMENGKTDFQFIRQVKIFPCYRVPHLAYYIGQPVTIFYNADGTIDKIEQSTIPSDSETIGNDISLIGFRYDNTFHAEWVDVWSNGANKSAFDLSGSQYLSLGIKAIYYDGSKADIDFYSLDRKKLTWDKAFSDFKENNGSPIKSLYFTPYTKTGVNNPWNKGNSTVVNFDENGNTSSSFDTGDDGTVHLDNFKLTGVVWNKPVVKNGTITWTGTTPNSDLLFVPDSDTLVTATYPRYDADLNTSYETWSTTTIGKGSMKVNVDYLIDYYKNSELAWNGEMWLTPCYKKGGVLYVGDPVVINCLKGTVSDIVVDKDSGKAEQVDKTEQNKSDADSILNVGNQFYSIINGLIGSLQQLPALLTAIFGFLPSSIINLLYASFAVIIICRILGR